MRTPVIFSKFLSLAAALAVAGSLCCAGPAWAGGGGESAPAVQSALNGVCTQLSLTSCPQLPTAAQIILEISGLVNSAPDNVRAFFLGNCTNFVFSGPPPGLCPQVAVNAVNAPVKSPPAEAGAAMSYLTPLAFTAGAAVTQFDDPAAKRFLYAAVLEGTDGQPVALDILLDDTVGTQKQFSKGPVIAFSLPLVILKNGTEKEVTATLQLTATCNGGASCLTGKVTGVLPGPGITAAALGLAFDYSFEASPNSPTPHRKYEVLIPIIATPTTDAAYFSQPPPCANGVNPLSGYCNAFSKPALGFALGAGASIGIAPYAAPLCTAATCPPPPTPTPTTFFGLCASFASVPAVQTFLQIGTDGTTAMSTPVSTTGIQCPPQS